MKTSEEISKGAWIHTLTLDSIPENNKRELLKNFQPDSIRSKTPQDSMPLSVKHNRHTIYKDKLKLAIIDSSDTWYAQPKQIYDELVKMGHECLWMARPNHEGAKTNYVPEGYISICIANNLGPIDFNTRRPLKMDHPPLERAYKSKADFVFAGDKTTFFRYFSDRPNAYYMPYGVNADIYRPINEDDEIYDVGFIGFIKLEERKQRIDLLKKHFRCFIGEKLFMDKANEALNKCRIIFNTSDHREINMRVFEALATGKLLVTDKVIHLDELFEDGIHLVTYSNEKELMQKISYYLENEKLRKEIGEKGREIVANHHTYRHRAGFIIEKIMESGILFQHAEKKQSSKNQKNRISQASKKNVSLNSKKPEKLNILLATNHLFSYTGSEITILTITEKLKDRGHNVSVYAKYIDPHFIRVFDGIAPVFNDIQELSRYQFNTAYVQHNSTALEIRHQYPGLPILFASLGVLPFLEQPPIWDLHIYKYLAISEEVKDNLIHKGIKGSSIEIFRNIVDSDKFKPIRSINPEPLTAIVYSYKISPENLNVIKKACEALNIECHHIGEEPGIIAQDKVAEELNKADIVFTLGRGVIETMMCGKIPIVYDYQGGDGMVTPENIHDLMSHNFSGRCFARQYQITEMIDEIKGYNPENAVRLRELAVELFDADRRVNQLISWLKESAMKPNLPSATERREEVRFMVDLVNITRQFSEDIFSKRMTGHADKGDGQGQINNSKRKPQQASALTESAPANIIAFYLPQFHPIPENDQWWGKGFTEWINVTKAKPLFPGHYQPHLPADLGFYDLRLPEVREAQAEMARLNGISGFCYYHYWFNGKRLLNRVFDEVMVTGKPDFPFCLCWANENWTRAWDGGDNKILIGQRYSREDDLAHITWLIRAFRDPRYIRIDGRPLFLIYRASDLTDPLNTAILWREEVKKAGFPDLYLCKVESFANEKNAPNDSGFDASVEFQPDWSSLGDKKPGYQDLYVYDYNDIVNQMIKKPSPEYVRFPCVTPSWDNSPRRGRDGCVFHNPNPVLYEKWLRRAISNVDRNAHDEKIIFINAWNEWGEGNHLEPDQRYGYAYLHATRRAVTTDNVKVKLNEQLTDRAAIALESGDLEEARQLLLEALSHDDSAPKTLHQLAVLFFHEGNLPGSHETLLRALEMDPRNAEFHNDLGAIYHANNETLNAQGHFEQAMEINPKDITAHKNLIDLFINEGKFDDARDICVGLKSLAPDDEETDILWNTINNKCETEAEPSGKPTPVDTSPAEKPDVIITKNTAVDWTPAFDYQTLIAEEIEEYSNIEVTEDLREGGIHPHKAWGYWFKYLSTDIWKTSPMLSIILTAKDNLNVAHLNIQLIFDNISNYNIELMVVGKGCLDESRNYSDQLKHKNLTLIPPDKGSTDVECAALGVEKSSGRFLMFLDDSVILTKSFLQTLMKIIERPAEWDAFTGKTVSKGKTVIEAGATTINESGLKSRGEGSAFYDPAYNFICEMESGSRHCMIMRRDLWDRVKGFNRDLQEIGPALIDMGLKIRSAGYRILYQPQSILIANNQAAQDSPVKDISPSPGILASLRPKNLPVKLMNSINITGHKNVLVLGIYLANKMNNINDIVSVFQVSGSHRVVQKWVALNGSPPDAKTAAVTLKILTGRFPKFQIINELLHEEDLSGYDYIILCDDDVILPVNFLDSFIAMQSGLEFAIAQPARTINSYIDHPIVQQHAGVHARQTLFVEIGPVVSFHRSAYEFLFPFDLTSPMGWGYENVWAHEAIQRNLKMGIIDGVCVDHSLRKPVANYEWYQADRDRSAYLDKYNHLPLEECFRVVNAHIISEVSI